MRIYASEFIGTNRNLLMSIATVIEYWRYCTTVVFHEYLVNAHEAPLFTRLNRYYGPIWALVFFLGNKIGTLLNKWSHYLYKKYVPSEKHQNGSMNSIV